MNKCYKQIQDLKPGDIFDYVGMYICLNTKISTGSCTKLRYCDVIVYGVNEHRITTFGFHMHPPPTVRIHVS